MDGNFGLVRKKSSGVSVRSPFYDCLYFEDDETGKTFVDSHSEKTDMDMSVSQYNIL